VAFSCKGRGLCPSCGAKRAAELAAFLSDEVVEEVGHARWVFTVPKMLWGEPLRHDPRLPAQLERMNLPPLRTETTRTDARAAD
jgi:hypothetical protein